jgi:malic enzyme
MYFSRNDKGLMRAMLDNWRLSDVAIIVVTDGSRILGLGDLGANGMGIPVGKLSLYVAAAGFHPALTLPVMLDFGTNNEALLADDLYIGQRHNRFAKEEYYSLVDEFLMAVKDKWPRCLLQFEDFSNDHCFDLLENYRNKLLCFNDDIQGTGAVVGSGFLNAVKLSGVPIRQHRIVFYGAGSAGVGVAAQIAALLVQETGCTVEEARQQFWFVDSRGLVTSTRGDKLEAHKVDFARKDIPVDGQIKSLIDVIKAVKPTALIGLSGQGGAFTQDILLEHFKHNQHPIVFPLSNPTKNSECTAKDAYTLSEGRALFASGSPFDPVEFNGHTYFPGQGNNMYIFPGLGFGAWLCHAKVVTDEMITAASRTLANCTSSDDLAQGRMYPPISRIRDISAVIAARVIEMAFKQGVAQIPKPEDALTFVRSNMWWPEYRPIEEAKL